MIPTETTEQHVNLTKTTNPNVKTKEILGCDHQNQTSQPPTPSPPPVPTRKSFGGRDVTVNIAAGTTTRRHRSLSPLGDSSGSNATATTVSTLTTYNSSISSKDVSVSSGSSGSNSRAGESETAPSTTTTTTSSNNKAGRRKSVHFSKVVVSEHNRILGDNVPSSGGAPITIDWTPYNTKTYQSVDEYENETHSVVSSDAAEAAKATNEVTQAVASVAIDSGNSADNSSSSGGGGSTASGTTSSTASGDTNTSASSASSAATLSPSRRSKTKDDMRMSAKERSELLYEMGYSKQQVRRASQLADTKREQRKWTKDTPDMQPVEELVEKGIKVFKKPLLRYFYNNHKHTNKRMSNVTMVEYHHPKQESGAAKAAAYNNQRRHSTPWDMKGGEKQQKK